MKFPCDGPWIIRVEVTTESTQLLAGNTRSITGDAAALAREDLKGDLREAGRREVHRSLSSSRKREAVWLRVGV